MKFICTASMGGGDFMLFTFKTIERLTKFVSGCNIAKLEIGSWGRKVKITKRYPGDTNAPAKALSDDPEIAEIVVPVISPIAIESPVSGVVELNPKLDTEQTADTPIGIAVRVDEVICVIRSNGSEIEVHPPFDGYIISISVKHRGRVKNKQELFQIVK